MLHLCRSLTSFPLLFRSPLIQIFEAMGMFISEESFRKHAIPCMEKIAKELRKRHPNTPLLVFPRGATYSLVDLQR